MVTPDSDSIKSMIVRIGVSKSFSESSIDLNFEPLFRVIASVPYSFVISRLRSGEGDVIWTRLGSYFYFYCCYTNLFSCNVICDCLGWFKRMGIQILTCFVFLRASSRIGLILVLMGSPGAGVRRTDYSSSSALGDLSASGVTAIFTWLGLGLTF